MKRPAWRWRARWRPRRARCRSWYPTCSSWCVWSPGRWCCGGTGRLSPTRGGGPPGGYTERLAAHPVEVRLPADLPPVWVDATLIVQVFANLFDNIAKYTPPGTGVWVSAIAGADGEMVRVTLDDDGPGLPAGNPARLFDKFQRGSGEGTVVGVGLGLAICQAIVRAHGGESEGPGREGGGARFAFTLPATQGPATEPLA